MRRTYTFNPVCFLYASLSRISKAETVIRRLFQTDNLFQPSDKKVTCLMRTQIKALGIFEEQRINFDIFVNFLKKKLVFLHFKTLYFFYFILQFLKESDTSEYNTAYLILFQTISVDIKSWCMHHLFAKVYQTNRKQITGKKIS